MLLDIAQSIKPGDLPVQMTSKLVDDSRRRERLFKLNSQMRVVGGNDYIDHVNRMLNGLPGRSPNFGEYEFVLFENAQQMRDAIVAKNEEVGLARMLAGYAWKWVSKSKPHLNDISIGELSMPWNRAERDWVNSATSIDEVGSIHTIQGYDLNYAGVIIGRDIQFDETNQRIIFSRANYFDRKGFENNPRRGLFYTDDDILDFVKNIYRVLLTRGIKGTYVYVCDEALREHLRPYFPVVR